MCLNEEKRNNERSLVDCKRFDDIAPFWLLINVLCLLIEGSGYRCSQIMRYVYDMTFGLTRGLAFN